MKQHELLKTVRQAFQDSPYPGDDRIVPGGRENDLEQLGISEFFRGKHWSEITLRSLEEEYNGDGSACLSLMAPEAVRYYMPSYMIITLCDYDIADVVADSAINALALPEDSDLKEWWHERMSGFTLDQERVIVAFLRYMYTHHKDDYPSDVLLPALEHWERCEVQWPANL